VLISPGPNNIYVITQGMTRGRKATFKAVAGASAGDMIQVLAAYFGLAALLQASSLAFLIVKILGAGYLFYVGVKCFFATGELLNDSTEAKDKGGNLFFTGFLTSALNPKTTLFFLSFLPQFIDNKSPFAHQQMLLFGTMFVILGFLVMSTYAFLAGKLKMWLADNERIQTYFHWLTGTIFIGFGLRLVLAERK
jgi:threonine/homoserine/homoserine lactone efflux protein